MQMRYLLFGGFFIFLLVERTNAQNNQLNEKPDRTDLSQQRGKQKISSSEFLLLPEEKQLHIRNNPNLYILDENLKSNANRPSRHKILRSEYESMPTSKKIIIDSNPDKYVIID